MKRDFNLNSLVLILPDKFDDHLSPFPTLIFLNKMAGVHNRCVFHSLCPGYSFLEIGIIASRNRI